MNVKATLRHLRIAPRKVRLVARLLAGKKVVEAEYMLSSIQKAAARPLLKLLLSAKANAKNNFNLDPETMVIESCLVNDGPVLKRYLPRAHGSANIIRKRSSHIHLTLKEVKPKHEGKKKPEVKGAKETRSKVQPATKKSYPKKESETPHKKTKK